MSAVKSSYSLDASMFSKIQSRERECNGKAEETRESIHFTKLANNTAVVEPREILSELHLCFVFMEARLKSGCT